MNKMMNKFYNKSDKPMAVINPEYIAHLKEVVARQTEVKNQTERALVKARAFNPKLDMIVAHYVMSSSFRRKNNIEEIDEWSPNV